MNQYHKIIYTLGSNEDVEYVCAEAALTPTEREILMRWRQKQTDQQIIEDLSLGDTYKDFEFSVRMKVATVVIHCIKNDRINSQKSR